MAALEEAQRAAAAEVEAVRRRSAQLEVLLARPGSEAAALMRENDQLRGQLREAATRAARAADDGGLQAEVASLQRMLQEAEGTMARLREEVARLLEVSWGKCRPEVACTIGVGA